MPVMQGVDVSSVQQDCDYAQLRKAGVQFAFVKCADWGNNGFFLDPFYGKHSLGLRAEGVWTGAYFFGHVTPSPIAAADYFIKHADLSQLRPVLDMETLMPDKTVPKNAGAWALAFMQRVEQSAKVQPILYSYLSYLAELGKQAPGLSKYQVWAAQYLSPPSPDHLPKLPAPFSQTNLVAYQFTGDGRLPGCPMPIDRDVLVVPDLQQICC